CLILTSDGSSWLAAHTSEGVQCVKECVTYDSQTFYTNNPDTMRLLNKAVARCLDSSSPIRRAGWQAEAMPKLIAATAERFAHVSEWAAVDDMLAEMQSRKDPDEIELIRQSIQIDLAAYTAVQAAIAPGVNELEVLAAGQRAAMLAAGEWVYHNGDYRSGAIGGQARNRAIVRGELYTIDAQTIYRGYWCDLSRTYIVGDEPTELQQSIHEHIAGIQQDVVNLLRPGMLGTEVWRILDERIRKHPALAKEVYPHHAGHGVGLRAHEAPDLNRDRQGILEPGNVVSVEPGGYANEARYGARLENMYLITKTGAQNLSEYPMNLLPQR
ncbi:MAG TPA: Xaa-Pro peptidase family protein, partial [Anaerolineae bacterium]